MILGTLFCVVVNDAECVARAAADAADTMTDGDTVAATGALHRPVASGENNSVALIYGDDFGAGLRARNIFH